MVVYMVNAQKIEPQPGGRGTFDRRAVFKQVATDDPIHQSQPQTQGSQGSQGSQGGSHGAWYLKMEKDWEKMDKNGKRWKKDMLVLMFGQTQML